MSQPTKHCYEFGSFRLDAVERLFLRNGEMVALTPKAIDLLLVLVERHGHLVEKEEVLKLVWPDTFVEEANLSYNISLIRKTLGEGQNGHTFIETVPKRGYRFVAEVREARPVADEKKSLTEQAASLVEETPEGLSKAPRAQVRLIWVVAAGVALIALAAFPFVIARLRRAPPAAANTIRFTIAAPEKATSIEAPELSPDGRPLVFRATTEGKTGLWLRPLDSLTAQPLPGTEGASGFPFWSPDSRSLGFDAGGELRKLDLAGGTPQTLCKLPPGGGAGSTWNRDGIILLTGVAGIYRVPATGGEPTLVLRSDQPNLYRLPAFLPDGRHYLIRRSPAQRAVEIHLATLDSQETTRLLAADSMARYANGYLFFARAGDAGTD